MRVRTHALGFLGSVAVTLVGFAGCGGTIAVNNAGATSAGGSSTHASSSSSSGAPGTTVAVSGSAVASSSAGVGGAGGAATTASSSAAGTGGGPTACTAGCSHLQSCGFNLCQMYNINCATVGDQYDCLLNCLSATPCAQLGLNTYATCNAQCMGDAGPEAGSPPPDGGTGITCATCVGQSCFQESLACGQDNGCRTWLQCIGGCEMTDGGGSPACYEACDAMNQAASSLYTPVYTCACQKCDSSCGVLDPCAAGTDGGP